MLSAVLRRLVSPSPITLHVGRFGVARKPNNKTTRPRHARAGRSMSHVAADLSAVVLCVGRLVLVVGVHALAFIVAIFNPLLILPGVRVHSA